MSLLFSNISLIVAYSKEGVIGYKNKLPWHLPEDLKWFKEKTLNKTVVMGSSTFESIGKPLPNRNNIVLTSKKSPKKIKGLQYANNLQQSAYLAEQSSNNKEIIYIGGSSVYEQILPFVKTLYVTEIFKKFKGDTYFNFDKKDFIEVKRINNKDPFKYDFVTYKRITFHDQETEKQEEE